MTKNEVVIYGKAAWTRALSDEEILILNGPPCPEKDALLAEATTLIGCFNDEPQKGESS